MSKLYKIFEQYPNENVRVDYIKRNPKLLLDKDFNEFWILKGNELVKKFILEHEVYEWCLIFNHRVSNYLKTHPQDHPWLVEFTRLPLYLSPLNNVLYTVRNGHHSAVILQYCLQIGIENFTDFEVAYKYGVYQIFESIKDQEILKKVSENIENQWLRNDVLPFIPNIDYRYFKKQDLYSRNLIENIFGEAGNRAAAKMAFKHPDVADKVRDIKIYNEVLYESILKKHPWIESSCCLM